MKKYIFDTYSLNSLPTSLFNLVKVNKYSLFYSILLIGSFGNIWAQEEFSDTTAAEIPTWEEMMQEAEISGLMEIELDTSEVEIPFEGHIHAIGRYRDGSITLRWGVDNAGLWYENNPFGYGIRRIAFNEEILYDPDNAVELINEPLKPWPEEKWEAYFVNGGDSDYMAIAAQIILGEYGLDSRMTMLGLSDEMVNRHGFAHLVADWDPLVAEALGMRWIDEDLEPGMNYAYEVYCLKDTLTGMPCYPGFTIIVTSEEEPIFTPEIDTISGKDKQVVLQWNTTGSLHNMSGFLIERSSDGGQTFQRVNENPFVNLLDKIDDPWALRFYTFHDSVPRNEFWYFYRIAGIDPFGEQTPWSEVYPGKADEPRPIAVPQAQVSETGDGRVIINWEVENEDHIFGYLVTHSTLQEGPYDWLNEDLFPPGTREFIHEKPNLLSMNYYIVYAFRDDGEYEHSMPQAINIIDTFPPAAPTGLEGFVDSLGVVHVNWKLGPEEDIYGYHVYINNQPEEVPSRVTPSPLFDTTYQHKVTLSTFNRMVVVRVVAMDMAQNASEISEPLILYRPDTIPPVSPVINAFEIRDEGIFINWIASTSLDVDYHLIFRKKSEDEEWIQIQRLVPEKVENQFLDTDVQHYSSYDYKFVAFDESGLQSEAASLFGLRAFTRIPLTSVVNFTSNQNGDQPGIELNWEWPHEEEVRTFAIYRQVDDHPFRLIRRVNGSENSFKDMVYPAGEKYRYQIHVELQNKRPVDLSDIVELTLAGSD